MNKTLSYVASPKDEGKTIGWILKERLHLTARQIRRVKFTPFGIQVTPPKDPLEAMERGHDEDRNQIKVTVKTVIHPMEEITAFFEETEE